MSPVTWSGTHALSRVAVVGLLGICGSTTVPISAQATECNPGPGAQCSGADLRGDNLGGQELVEADFTRADVRGANFSDATLGAATFARARANRADFQNAILERTDFSGARLRGAQFFGAYMTGTRFVGAVLTDVDLSGVQTEGVQGRRAVVREVLKAKLCRTTLPDAKVSNRDC